MNEEQVRRDFEAWWGRQSISVLVDVSPRLVADRAWLASSTLYQSQVRELREALERIAAIEDELYGGDWEEIEKAREIASAALSSTKEEQQPNAGKADQTSASVGAAFEAGTNGEQHG